MSTQTFVLTIIIMVLIFAPPLVKLVLSHRERTERLSEMEATRRANGELLQRIDALEERIHVLERIVTDDGYELKRRFRELGG